MKTIRLIVRGKVQGVYYRASAKNIADQLGITGWIRNLPDQNVEISATATDEILQKFIHWCRQGPTRATVDEVIIKETTIEESIGFRIIR